MGEPSGALGGELARVLAAPPPFYRTRLAGAAAARPPLTRRAELVADQLAHPPHGTRRAPGAAPPVRAGASGSGPDLLVLTWTAADLARERAAGVRLLGRLGVAPGMRVANTLPGALATPGSLLLGDVVEELRALDVPLGPVGDAGAARQAWELFDRVEADVLVVDAASAGPLFAGAPPAARPWWRGIVRLWPADAPPPAFAGWQRTWLAVPEATSFVAGECAQRRLHADDGLVVEVVDEAGTSLPAGTAGLLALTPLGPDAPLLRYASGLRGRIASCACGGAGTVVDVDRP